jgi:fructokinase
LAGYNAEIIAESLKLATLVKMNEAELEEVSQLLRSETFPGDSKTRMMLQMEWLCEEYSLDAAAITRGSKGACLFIEKRHLKLPDSTFDQALVHPVGAGDAFAAGLLFGMMQGLIPEQCMELANLLSSFVVQQVSAIPILPGKLLEQIHLMLSTANGRESLEASQAKRA